MGKRFEQMQIKRRFEKKFKWRWVVIGWVFRLMDQALGANANDTFKKFIIE
jgi:hypothetical protein